MSVCSSCGDRQALPTHDLCAACDDSALDDAEQLKPVCGFCKGGPVGNAATWLDGKPRPPAPCPRCGKTAPSVFPSAEVVAEDWQRRRGGR